MPDERFKVIDIGHSNFRLDTAIALLETTVSQYAYEGRIRGIKIITGHGSGKLRYAVEEWCLEQEGRFRAVIPGEDYDMFNQKAIDMRRDCDHPHDLDYGRKNQAVIYLWLR